MASDLLIVNPFASAVDDATVAKLVRVLGDVEVRYTEHRGHATELAREASGQVDTIYVFSGDGGFNEVLNGVDARTALGLIPGGGASVLPRALGLPRRPVEAAHRLLTRRTRRISLGRVNGRRFGFSAGIGLDAELVRRVDALGRSLEQGRASNVRFAWTALRLLAEHRFRLAPVLQVRRHGRAAFALCANCDPYTYAGRIPLHIAPLARFELGIDIVGARTLRPAALPRFLAYVLSGRGQEHAPDVLYAHDLDRAEIVCDGPLPLQADGEDVGDVTGALVEAERDAVTVLI